jgi:hypothetical protein
MTKTIITTLPDPYGFSPDPLTDLLRSGAHGLIQQAVEAERSGLLEAYSGDRIEDGRARRVRHGHLPEREVMKPMWLQPERIYPTIAPALRLFLNQHWRTSWEVVHLQTISGACDAAM